MTETKNLSNSPKLLVRRAHPTVIARQPLWEEIAEQFEGNDRPNEVIIPITNHYGCRSPIVQSILTKDFLESGAWVLGPYPDGGYWLVEDLAKYQEMQSKNYQEHTSLILAALRHLERALVSGEDLGYLSDIISLNGYKPSQIDAICQWVNFGGGTKC